MWEQLSAEQKQNYGEDYFERALRSLEKYTEKVMKNIFKLKFFVVFLIQLYNRNFHIIISFSFSFVFNFFFF